MSAGLTPAAADARTPLNLHKVDWKNATVPGSTCFSKKPIKLTNGQGHGGTFHGDHLVVWATPKPIYGDLAGSRADEALLEVDCDTGGGTAASQVKFSWVVFSGYTGHLVARGVIVGTHEHVGTHAELLTPQIAHRQVFVKEAVYGPSDSDCCPTHTAYARWSFHKGTFELRASHYVVNDLLMSGNAVGHATVGMTLRRLRASYPKLKGGALSTPGWSQYYDGAHPNTTWYATLVHGVVVRVFANSDAAMTTRGAGMFTSEADLKTNYRGYTVHHESVCGEPVLTLHTESAWSVFFLTTQYGSTYVNGMDVQRYEPNHDQYVNC